MGICFSRRTQEKSSANSVSNWPGLGVPTPPRRETGGVWGAREKKAGLPREGQVGVGGVGGSPQGPPWSCLLTHGITPGVGGIRAGYPPLTRYFLHLPSSTPTRASFELGGGWGTPRALVFNYSKDALPPHPTDGHPTPLSPNGGVPPPNAKMCAHPQVAPGMLFQPFCPPNPPSPGGPGVSLPGGEQAGSLGVWAKGGSSFLKICRSTACLARGTCKTGASGRHLERGREIQFPAKQHQTHVQSAPEAQEEHRGRVDSGMRPQTSDQRIRSCARERTATVQRALPTPPVQPETWERHDDTSGSAPKHNTATGGTFNTHTLAHPSPLYRRPRDEGMQNTTQAGWGWGGRGGSAVTHPPHQLLVEKEGVVPTGSLRVCTARGYVQRCLACHQQHSGSTAVCSRICNPKRFPRRAHHFEAQIVGVKFLPEQILAQENMWHLRRPLLVLWMSWGLVVDHTQRWM